MKQHGPGSELDALVASKVMGLALPPLEIAACPYCGDEMRFCGERSRCTTCSEWRYGPAKEYSTDIDAAWEVLEKLRSDGFDVEVSATEVEDKHTPGWTVECDHDRSPYRTYAKHPNAWKVETAPLAICRAALKTTLSFVERSSSI